MKSTLASLGHAYVLIRDAALDLDASKRLVVSPVYSLDFGFDRHLFPSVSSAARSATDQIGLDLPTRVSSAAM
jgi:hypothetical protein